MVVPGDASVRRGDRERIAPREGGGGEGGGQRQRVATKCISIRGICISRTGLELLELVEQVSCALRLHRIEAAAAARASLSRGSAVPSTGTTATASTAIIVATTTTSAVAWSRRPQQGFGLLQNCCDCTQIACSDGRLKLGMVARAQRALDSVVQSAGCRIRGRLEQSRKARSSSSKCGLRRSGQRGGTRAVGSSWWKDCGESRVDLLLSGNEFGLHRRSLSVEGRSHLLHEILGPLRWSFRQRARSRALRRRHCRKYLVEDIFDGELDLLDSRADKCPGDLRVPRLRTRSPIAWARASTSLTSKRKSRDPTS